MPTTLLLAPPEFGSSVNPIPTRGGRLCPPARTPRFKNLTTSLGWVQESLVSKYFCTQWRPSRNYVVVRPSPPDFDWFARRIVTLPTQFPEIWRFKKEDRKRNIQYITVSSLKFENLTTSLS